MTCLYVGLIMAVWLTATRAVASELCQNMGSTTRKYTLNITAGYGSPEDGFARPILLVNGETPGSTIKATQGEAFAVTVNNMLAIQIGMHWHGLHQQGTPEFDGVPGLNQYAIAPGSNLTYCFGTDSNYGAYWYHVHLRDVYQDGIRGPILIQPSDPVERPYGLISNTSDDIGAMHRAEQSPVMLMVNDWFHQTSDEIALRLAATQDSMRPLCASSILFNGMGRVECPATTSGKSSFGCMAMGGMGGMGSGVSGSMSTVMTAPSSSVGSSMSTGSSTMTMSMGSAMSMASSMTMGPSMSVLSSMSKASGMTMPSSSVNSTSPTRMDPADEVCQNTTSLLYVLSLHDNATWHMVHLINAGASQQLAISFDEHDFWVVSADGAFVMPQKAQVLNIGIGQRYGIMLRKPDQARKVYSIRASTMTHQVYQGTALLSYDSPDSNSPVEATSSPWIGVDGSPFNSTARRMDDSVLAPYPVEAVPQSNREIRLEVNQSQPTVWVLESGQPFASNNGQQTPLLFSPRNASGIYWLGKGDVVDILLQVAADSLDTMAHPIHLHGHYFRVLGSAANSTFPTNKSVVDVASGTVDSHAGMALNTNSTAPRRDTAHLPEAGWLAIRFAADNPGVWLLHCHINSHLSSGMAVAFIELADEFPSFPSYVTTPPGIAPLPPIPELQ